MPGTGSRSARGALDTILVVDDNESSRRLLCAIVRRGGCEVLEAADGTQALSCIQTERPDLILLDAVMPGLSGYDVCDELSRRGDTTPVIFLSSLSNPADRIAGLERGAVDFISKPFDPHEVIARIATQLRLRRLSVELERTNRLLNERQQRLEEDLRAAAEVQRSLLPAPDSQVPGLEVAWRFLPCQSLGGDLLRFHALGLGTAALWVLDVAGHGTPASLLTAAVWQALTPDGQVLRGVNASATSPSAVLGRLDQLFPIERFERHFTLAFLVFDTTSGELRYSSAGHPPPLLLGRDACVVELHEGGPLVGLGTDLPFEEGRVSMDEGDRVLVVSDGILEATDAQGQAYGAERLATMLRRTRGLPLESVCDALVEDVVELRGGEPFDDDVTILVFSRVAHRTDRQERSGDLHVTIDAEIENVRLAASALRRWCAGIALDDAETARVETATVEALNNAVIHGDPGTAVTMRAGIESDAVLIEISGEGPSFDPDRLRRVRAEEADTNHQIEGGRGWRIMKACMDDAGVRRQGNRNIVRLRRRIATTPGAPDRLPG